MAEIDIGSCGECQLFRKKLGWSEKFLQPEGQLGYCVNQAFDRADVEIREAYSPRVAMQKMGLEEELVEIEERGQTCFSPVELNELTQQSRELR